ncbi:protein singles bar [Neodiprion pinetum]|uniref:Protein singles bar n=1 Tax=Neodiprion lecontei TaxID=441921 RepID=A0A6J0BEL1_NEOLC|nr:protein singles bar [Neodiprion lecontei]XP_015513270.2 protein singles bar [Neodiprion lecontei]XP_046413030.1 protein singles bar [Neodiprion fabricii]XP_046413031.1 protein singles bar [Neodiprion fabricii]XP_046413032.1 protein singles bar [Neodiprion fabricii]XP_046413033.1 protein singles bar [Neodiprion fabricii]XP_046413035.1 protein singles bar [Neodiprion fabricii]XP_046413036.1 protein singles bar [Neodiprion fabricii]XP_046468611.1 protein singles bar [Neodiprion pinetum]XP_
MGGGAAGPTIRMASTGTHGAGGVACCFCRCCTCIHIEFLKTLPGMVKVAEAVISSLIQYLLINYGLRYSATIGSAYESALTTCSACFLNSAVLLACYIVSEKSYRLIRSSLFELMFNALASFLYLSSASYLAFATKMFLWGQYLLTPGFDVYPAMSAAYMLCGVVGVLHGVDAYYSYKHYTGSW